MGGREESQEQQEKEKRTRRGSNHRTHRGSNCVAISQCCPNIIAVRIAISHGIRSVNCGPRVISIRGKSAINYWCKKNLLSILFILLLPHYIRTKYRVIIDSC